MFAPVVGVLVISVFILCCSVCICFACCRRKSKKHFNDDPADLPVNVMLQDNYFYQESFEMDEKKDEVPISLWMPLAWGAVCNLPAGIQGVIKRHSVDRRSLTILATVSRGDYGCIVNGQLCTNRNDPVGGYRNIMMKMSIGFKKQYGHRDEITKFLETATLLRGVDHPNIHSLLRVSAEDNYVPLVVYPIMEYGNLQQFLVLSRITPADSPLGLVTLQYRVSFAYQIVNGMKHLSGNSIVHPDLALRNCYLDTNYQVKISDGALSQCFYPDCYNAVRGTVRPVRWAALETLQEGLCTSQSNVWSYGVVVWELMTLSKLPYYDQVDHNRGVLTHLMLQNRLSQPDGCPDNIYTIMIECWKSRAEDRPSFDALLSSLHSKYPSAVQSAALAPPTNTHGGGHSDIHYSTFGKDIRTHDAPPLETASLSIGGGGGSFPRRGRSGGATGGSLRGSLPRGSPVNSRRSSQRNSQNLLGTESLSGVVGGDRLSITFSVLSNDTELDRQSSVSSGEEEGEEGERNGLNFEIPSFLTTGQSGAYGEIARDESPMDMVSTFLPAATRATHDDQSDGTATFLPPPVASHPLPHRPAPAPPPHITSRHPSSPNAPGGGSGSHGNAVLTPPPFSGSPTPNTAPSVSVTPSNTSKPSTPDSLTTYSSSHHSMTPSSHIPGIPASTYNSTSVSIDDIKLRNKSLLLSTNSHSASIVSTTPSGASKSDSGIRSDEEVESVLSNNGGGRSSGVVTPMVGHVPSSGRSSEVVTPMVGRSVTPMVGSVLSSSDGRRSSEVVTPMVLSSASDGRRSSEVATPMVGAVLASDGGPSSSSCSEVRSPVTAALSVSSVGGKEEASETSQGIAGLSSDLMATFAAWGKD